MLILIIVLLGLIVGIYLIKQRTNILPQANAPLPKYESVQAESKIEDDNDLVGSMGELDNINIDAIDNELKDSDLSF